MVGGIVREVLWRETKIWVNVMDTYRPDSYNDCAIYVVRNEDSERIKPGDSLWWQGKFAMWTPNENRDRNSNLIKCGTDYDIQIPRVGYSGVAHPGKKLIDYAFVEE